MKKINLGIIGLGNRGYGLLYYVLLEMDEFNIVALTDTYSDRIEQAQQLCKSKKNIEPKGYESADGLVQDDNVDAVLIASSWETHIPLAIKAMQNNVAVALEVGGSSDLQTLWDLVDTYEKTKTPLMFMENCCYGRLELMTLNMVQNNVLGEIVYAHGAYAHDLRDEITFGKINRHYRLNNYIKRNSENYPTHEIGPIAKILNINNGNRFLSLSSHASKSVGLNKFLENHDKSKLELPNNIKFNQGDIVNTQILCANGELVSIKLDTTLPRYYSREFFVQGTKGLVNEENMSVFLESDIEPDDHFNWSKNFNNVDKYYEKYDHPIWKQYLNNGVRAGHDGMDYLVFKAFADALIEGREMPIDVYDAATWMAITALSEQSLATGSQVQYFPDFTRGKWIYEQDTKI